MFGNWLALAPRTSEEQPNRGAGLRVPSLSLALGTPQGREQAKPGAFEAQASEMVEDRLPRWKVTRQVAPRTAGAQSVEDCIENGTQGVDWRPAASGQGREMVLQTLPLRIRKIAWITRTHPSSLSHDLASAISKTRS